MIAIHSKQSRLYRYTPVGRIEGGKQTGKHRYQSKIMEPRKLFSLQSACLASIRTSAESQQPKRKSGMVLQAWFYIMVISVLGGENRKMLGSQWPTNSV